jgi:hypothetical protein
MEDPASVSGACTQCFTGFGQHHEPQCPFFEERPLIIPPDGSHRLNGSTDERSSDLERRLRKVLMTDAGMTHFLNDLVGPGNWAYDRTQDIWTVPDKKVSIKRGGEWFQSE